MMIGQKYDVMCFDMTPINIKREDWTKDVWCEWGKCPSQSTPVPISLIHIYPVLVLFCTDQDHQSPCPLILSSHLYFPSPPLLSIPFLSLLLLPPLLPIISSFLFTLSSISHNNTTQDTDRRLTSISLNDLHST